MIELNKIYNENCLSLMSRISNETIDLCLTSPPYDNLRKYDGYCFEFEKTAKELTRILKMGGVIVWVVGDATINGSESGTSFKQILYFKDICGLNLHDTMIYAKNTIIPLTHNRYEQEFEYMFVLSKGKPKIFNPIKIDSKCAGVIKTTQSSSWRLGETSSRARDREDLRTVSNTKIKGNIWYYNPTVKDEFTKQHPATFPEQLAYDHIVSWTNENDIVFDLMAGSGTTIKMAKKLKRNYIGSEISKEYCDIIQKRISET